MKSPTTIVRRVVDQYSATSAALTSFDGIPNDANNRVKTMAKNYSFSSSEEFIIDAIFDSMVNRSCKATVEFETLQPGGLLIPRGLFTHQRLTEKVVQRSCRNTIGDIPQNLHALSFNAVPNITRRYYNSPYFCILRQCMFQLIAINSKYVLFGLSIYS